MGNMGTNYYEFANVNDVEVLLDPGTMSVEARLLLVDGEDKIEMTLDSNVYENKLGDFMLHTGLNDKYKDTAEKVMSKVSEKTVVIGGFTQFTLKSKYKKKLTDAVKLEEKLGNYMPN